MADNTELSGKIKAGVIGSPIAHSLSPFIHNYWLDKYGINGQYDAIEVKTEDLLSFFKNMVKNGYSGVNVTLPHKETMLTLLQNCDPFAKFIGAVNTVIFREEGLIGTNTDFLGFARNLKESAPEFDFTKGKAVVIGAGGAARAVVFALASMGVPEIIITNRTKDKAETICNQLIESVDLPKDKILSIEWEKRDHALKDANLVVNTTSLGMVKQPALELDLSQLPVSSLVTDIVYNPLETDLLRHAKDRGNITVDGLGMLLHQAVPGFEAWFGKKPEVTTELRDYIISVLLEKNQVKSK